MTITSSINSVISSIRSYAPQNHGAEPPEVEQAGIGFGIVILIALISAGCSGLASLWPQAEGEVSDGGGSDVDVDEDVVVDADRETRDTDPDVDEAGGNVDTDLDTDIDEETDAEVDRDEATCTTMMRIGPEVRISDVDGIFGWPSLVWAGGEYGVSWVAAAAPNFSFYFNRLSPTGEVLSSDSHITDAVLGATVLCFNPSFVWTGSEYGITWGDSRHGSGLSDVELYFARLLATGVQIGSSTRLTNASGNSVCSDLALAGSEYGVIWSDNRDGNYEIYFKRVTADGLSIGSDIRITNDSNYSQSPSLVWTGTEYGATWLDNPEVDPSGIYFRRIRRDGTLVGSNVRLSSVDMSGIDSRSAASSFVWTGTEYGIAWINVASGAIEIYLRRISWDGLAIGSEIRVVSAGSGSGGLSLVWNGTEYGLAWADNRHGNQDIYFRRLSWEGSAIGLEVQITSDPGDATKPSLAWSGREYAVSWQDNRDGGVFDYEIYFARIGCEGEGE